MAKDPAFLWYPGDWLGGTMLMSRSHKGAYMDLLMAQFNNGHMGEQEIKILLGDDYALMWELVLKSKFKQDESGKYFNQKLENEINKRKKFTESRKNNLKSDKKNIPHTGSHMDGHMENENENINRNKDKKEGGTGGENTPQGNDPALCCMDLDKLKDELLQSQAWKEVVLTHPDMKGITEKKLDIEINTFIQEVKISDDAGRPIKDYKRHFLMWLKKKQEKQRTNGKSIREKADPNSGKDRGSYDDNAIKLPEPPQFVIDQTS